MKKFSWRALPLCLVALLAAGLLALPASADAEVEGGEIIIAEGGEPILDTMDPDTKCLTAGGWTWDLSLLDEVTKDMPQEEKSHVEALIEATIQRYVAMAEMEEGQLAQEDLQEMEGIVGQAAYCTNPNHPKVNKPTYEYAPSSDSLHTVTSNYWEICDICMTRRFLSSHTTFEHHTFGSGQYISSNHVGAASNHTITYEYTCVCCKYTKRAAVPAGCRDDICYNSCSAAEPSSEP